MKARSLLKYIPWVLVILALGYGVFSQYQAASAARALLATKTSELMKSNLELGRAQTKIVEQDKLMKVALAEIDSKWKDEIKKRQGLVTLYAKLEAKYNAKKRKVKVRTKVVYRDGPNETVDLPKNKLYIRQDNGDYKEITSMQWSYKDFRITISGDAVKESLSYTLHQHFSGQLIETSLPTNGRNHYFKLYELDDKNERVGTLKLEKFDVLRVDESRPHMMWWNPKLDLGVGLGMTHKVSFSWLAEFGFSASGYGRTQDDLTWRFFRIGTGITPDGFSLTFSPVQLNVGKYLPLISNLWFTTYGGYAFGNQAAHFGFGFSLVL